MFKQLVDFSSYETIGIVTMVVFFLAFVTIIIRALVLKKSYTEEMGRLPLDDGTEDARPGNDNELDSKE